MRIEVEDVKRRKSEDGAGNHATCRATDSGHDYILEQTRSALVNAGQTDGEDGDGDCGFHYLTDFEAGIGRSHGKDNAKRYSPEYGSCSEFRRFFRSRYERRVAFVWLEGPIGVFWKRLRVDHSHRKDDTPNGRR